MSREFDKFWKAWPRKVSRKPAEVKWSKLQPDEQRAAIADVEKRNRLHAWSSNPRLIPHAATYLNQERWTDEWEEELAKSRRGDDLPNSGPYMPKVIEPEIEMSWEEQMLNRVGRSYLLTAMGLPDTERLVAAKSRIMDESVPAYREDMQAGSTERSSIARELVDLFLTRLDHAYNKNLKDRVIKNILVERKWTQ